MKNLIIIFSLIFSFQGWISVLVAQQVVSGRITDASNGEPLYYASIYIANSTVGTFSDKSGNYTITMPGVGSYEIVVTYLGYKSFFHKIEAPKSFHKIDIALEKRDIELHEIVISPRYTQEDVDKFWYMLLREYPSKKGMEVLNPDKVYFYFDEDSIFRASCDEPIEIINHEMGYHILYMLESFHHDYRINNTVFSGKPFFKELVPQNVRQKNNWEKKRQAVYAISITHFIRALYRDKLHEEGFLLAKRDSLTKRNIYFPLSADILQKDQNSVQIVIDSPLFLACFSKPVTDKVIKNSERTMYGWGEFFPVSLLFEQQFSIFPDGTYNGTLILHELEFRKQISGLSAMLPVEYGQDLPFSYINMKPGNLKAQNPTLYIDSLKK